MAKRDMQNNWGVLGDIIANTSWPIRIGFLLGLGVAILIWINMLSSGVFVSEGASRTRVLVGFAVLSLVGLLLAGGLVGLVVGVLLEVVMGKIKGDTKSSTPRTRWSGRRRGEEDE